MKRNTLKQSKSAQTMVEYLLLLIMVTAFVLIGLNVFVERGRDVTENTFTSIGAGIAGKPAKSY